MSLGSGVIPHFLLGNPFGPVPPNGKYYYMDDLGIRNGPFDTKEEAEEDMNTPPHEWNGYEN